MSTRMCAIAENHSAIINELKKNDRLQHKIFTLNHSQNHWHLSEEGLLIIDLGVSAYKKSRLGEEYASKYIPLVDAPIQIDYNDEEVIRSLGCSVEYLPDDLVVQYFKNLAKMTTSKVGLIMLHERGDELYDSWTWAFDYSVHPYKEFFDAATEAKGVDQAGYWFWKLSGCPFKQDAHYNIGCPTFEVTPFYELFKISWFPCITDLLPLKAGGLGIEKIF